MNWLPGGQTQVAFQNSKLFTHSQEDGSSDPAEDVLKLMGHEVQESKLQSDLYSPALQGTQVSDDPKYPSPGGQTHDITPATSIVVKGKAQLQFDESDEEVGLLI